MKKIGGMLVAVTLLLTGCSVDLEAAANNACGEEIKWPESFNESKNGDLSKIAGTVRRVEKPVITQPATATEDYNYAFNMYGTAEILDESHTMHTVTWNCFAQTVDGKTYSAITEWKTK